MTSHESIDSRSAPNREFIEPEKTTDYWYERGQNFLKSNILNRQKKKVAKNVILFLGDGMGIPTTTAARIYAGQLSKGKGEDSSLAFDKFPNVGLSKVDIISCRCFRISKIKLNKQLKLYSINVRFRHSVLINKHRIRRVQQLLIYAASKQTTSPSASMQT